MNLLPIGSVVRLYNGDANLMILNRYPLYNENGNIGYFEYSGTIYPFGRLEEQVYYFNQENIERVIFKGYIDESEISLQEYYEEKISDIEYPKFNVENS